MLFHSRSQLAVCSILIFAPVGFSFRRACDSMRARAVQGCHELAVLALAKYRSPNQGTHFNQTGCLQRAGGGSRHAHYGAKRMFFDSRQTSEPSLWPARQIAVDASPVDSGIDCGAHALEMARLTFPKTLREFRERFVTESACLNYMWESRWPEGFRCPRCGHVKAWPLAKRRIRECQGCGLQISQRQALCCIGVIFPCENGSGDPSRERRSARQRDHYRWMERLFPNYAGRLSP